MLYHELKYVLFNVILSLFYNWCCFIKRERRKSKIYSLDSRIESELHMWKEI